MMDESEPLRSDINVNDFIVKLGHRLEDIRVRALNSLVQKLEFNLINVSDLVQEKLIFVRLLEWFNFAECGKQVQVFKLLYILSTQPSGARNLQEVGGIEFLCQLKRNISDAAQIKTIDDIVAILLRLPSDEAIDSCMYVPHDQLNVEGKEVRGTTLSTTRDRAEIIPSIPKHAFSELHVGYFLENTSQTSTVAFSTAKSSLLAVSLDTQHSKCVILPVLPWIGLTSTDRQVLASAETSLRDSKQNKLVNTSQFVSDVVLHDFPAEVLIQRPSIVSLLLNLMGQTNMPEDVSLSVIKCLITQTTNLLQRSLIYSDPGFHSINKQDNPNGDGSLSSTTLSSHPVCSQVPVGGVTELLADVAIPRKSMVISTSSDNVIEVSDGYKASGGDSSQSTGNMSNIPVDQTLDTDTRSLRNMQISIPEYCLKMIASGSALCMDSNITLVSKCIELMDVSTKLFIQCVSVDAIWVEDSDVSRLLIPQLQSIFESLSQAIIFHHHVGDTKLGRRENEVEIHRIIYLDLSSLMMNMLTNCISIGHISQLITSNISPVINYLAWDAFYQLPSPLLMDLHAKILPDEHKKLAEANCICESMYSLWKFQSSEGPYNQLIDWAEQAVLALGFLDDMSEFLQKIVQLTSNICSHVEPSPYLVHSCRKMLLLYMAHPLNIVRSLTLSHIRDMVKAALCVDNVCDPVSTSCNKARFVLSTNILEQLCAYGLDDAIGSVGDCSLEVIELLFKGRLLMTGVVWDEFIKSVTPVLPLLQSMSSKTTSLGCCLVGLSEEPTIFLSYIDRLKGSLRALLSPEPSVRGWGLSKIAEILRVEDGGETKLPYMASAPMPDIKDILVVENPKLLEIESSRIVFTRKNLIGVHEIFTSGTISMDVRRSALEQLSVMLEDREMHTQFCEEGGLEQVIRTVESAIMKPNAEQQYNDESLNMMAPGLTILKLLVHHNAALRHDIANDPSWYLIAIRCALTLPANHRVCYETAHLLTLLLFNEYILYQNKETEGNQVTVLSFKDVIKNRYHLPFIPSLTHDTVSPFTLTNVPNPETLKGTPTMEKIKVAYNQGFHGDRDSLVAFSLLQNKDITTKYVAPKNLMMSFADYVICWSTYTGSGLSQCLTSITNATGHYSVRYNISKLLAYLQITRLTKLGYNFINELLQSDWLEIFSKFLKVLPVSCEDERLLTSVISLLLQVLLDIPNEKGREPVVQLIEIINYKSSSSLLEYITNKNMDLVSIALPECHVEARHDLRRGVLLLVNYLNMLLPEDNSWQLSSGASVLSYHLPIMQVLLNELNIADAHKYYDIAAIHQTVQCIVCVTSQRGWSNRNDDICDQTVSALLDVIVAFHEGRGGTARSYLGRSVTLSAAMALRHLTCENSMNSQGNLVIEPFIYRNHNNQHGLIWLLPLWAYRSVEVRAAGLGIASAVSAVSLGRVYLTQACHQLAGGLWALMLNILLDSSECSQVRQEAALVLCNMVNETSLKLAESQSDDQLHSDSSVVPDEKSYQGPCVVDEDSGLTIYEHQALEALIQHTQFFKKVSAMISQTFTAPVSALPTTHWTAGNPPDSDFTLTDGGEADLSSAAQSLSLPPNNASQLDISNQELSANSGLLIDNTTEPVKPQSRSIITPSLCASVLQLCQNLVCVSPQYLARSILKDGVLGELTKLCGGEKLSHILKLYIKGGRADREKLNVLFLEVAWLVEEIISTFQSVVYVDAIASTSVLLQPIFMLRIIRLGMSVSSGISDTTISKHAKQQLFVIWDSMVNFLLKCLLIRKDDALPNIVTALSNVWKPFIDDIQLIVSSTECPPARDSSLRFLSVLFGYIGKAKSLCGATVLSVDNEVHCISVFESFLDDEETKKFSSGCVLSKCLVEVYEAHLSSSNPRAEAVLANDALRNLLYISTTAKQHCLESGLVESTIDRLKQLNAKLNIDSLDKQKRKRYEESRLRAIVGSLKLLQSLLHSSKAAKLAALHSGLTHTIQKLWQWCCLSCSVLLSPVLRLLTTYVLDCEQACCSLAYTKATATTPLSGGNKALLHCLLRLTTEYLKETESNWEYLLLLFNVLAAAAKSTEGRGIIWKMNFLQGFSDLNLPKVSTKNRTKSPWKHHPYQLWFKILLSFSFYDDGQLLIAKLSNSVDILLDFIDELPLILSKTPFIILRNLSFSSTNKPKILANPRFISCLKRRLNDQSEPFYQLIACNTLWALLYNNQKARVSIKNAGIPSTLQSQLTEYLNNTENNDSSFLTTEYLHHIDCVISLIDGKQK